jgi:hypothetical protein
MADEPPPPILQMTPLNANFRDDPHAIYRRVREAHPVYRDDMAGSNIITRYKLVRETLNDRSMLRGPDKVQPPGPFTQRLTESFEKDPDTGEARSYSILLMDRRIIRASAHRSPRRSTRGRPNANRSWMKSLTKNSTPWRPRAASTC